ncbi:MAG: hypothetical protein ABL891_19295 [Burkholderiales bacterium]
MNALWLLPPSEFGESDFALHPEQALLRSPLASIRLRTAVAASSWRDHGYHSAFLNPEHPDALLKRNFADRRICICGKFFGDLDADKWLAACRRAKDQGCRLLIDISDFPADSTRFYDEVLQFCDAVTVNSGRMAELMASKTAKRLHVIEDAILGAPRRPAFSPGKVLELLWFGHPSNLPYLERSLKDLADLSARQACRLTIVTATGHGVEDSVRELNTRLPEHFQLRFCAWSIEATRSALRKCDLVLIPGDPADPRKSGVSSNRIAEALNAGRFPVASPLNSYLPFSEAAFLGQDLRAGIAWAMANPGEVMIKIRRGQALVAEQLSLLKIGERWRSVIASTANDASTQSVSRGSAETEYVIAS